MQIILNGKTIETQQATLEELLSELGYGDCSVAIAIDGEFIPKANRQITALADGQTIEVVAPMQGG